MAVATPETRFVLAKDLEQGDVVIEPSRFRITVVSIDDASCGLIDVHYDSAVGAGHRRAMSADARVEVLRADPEAAH